MRLLISFSEDNKSLISLYIQDMQLSFFKTKLIFIFSLINYHKATRLL